MSEVISTDRAPGAIGPYAQAIDADGWLYLSGQIALSPATGVLAEGGVQAQTDQVLRNLSAVLEAAGCGLGQVIKTTVYLVDMADFQEMNETYVRWFSGHRPARATVGVAALPMGARVEIDAVARRA